MKVHCDEGVATHIDPKPCARRPRGRRRSVGRGAYRPAIEPRNRCDPGCRRRSLIGRQNGLAAANASARPTRRGLRPCNACMDRSLRGNREISGSAIGYWVVWSVAGR